MDRPPTSNCGDRPPSPVSAPGCKSYFFSTSIIHYYYVKPFALVNANEWTGCLQCLVNFLSQAESKSWQTDGGMTSNNSTRDCNR